MKILVIAEHNNAVLKQATYHAVSAARQISDDIDLFIAGDQLQKVAAQASTLVGVKQVLAAEALDYQHQLPENLAPLLVEISQNYTHILATTSTFSKNLLPRLAALLDMGMLSDVSKIISADLFERPIYAGNAIATVKSTEAIKILTVRGTAFAITDTQTSTATINMLDRIIPNTSSRFESRVLQQSERPELTSARIVVAGGRGLKSSENFKLVEKLADQLGAAVAASRAAVDAGFAPNDYQVGQTGKVVAPDLYIAIGISGAIQHLAGMKDSKVIVAINNDPDAPIFEVADYGLVADLFAVLPELQAKLT